MEESTIGQQEPRRNQTLTNEPTATTCITDSGHRQGKEEAYRFVAAARLEEQLPDGVGIR